MEGDKHQTVRSSKFAHLCIRVCGMWELNVTLTDNIKYWRNCSASVQFDRIELDGFVGKKQFSMSFFSFVLTFAHHRTKSSVLSTSWYKCNSIIWHIQTGLVCVCYVWMRKTFYPFKCGAKHISHWVRIIKLSVPSLSSTSHDFFLSI